jgi:hypothetical protein
LGKNANPAENRKIKEEQKMAAISCDICGGTLSMDSSGDFAVCDSCGTKHTKERMKTKAQEITGTVAVSNIAGIDSLMDRGNLALEDSKWKEADEYFDKVLDIDAKYAPAYIGKLCVELKVRNEADLANYKEPLDARASPNYQKALRFADTNYHAKVSGYNQGIKDRIAEGQDQDQKHFTEYQEKQKNQIQKQKKYHGCISAGHLIVALRTNSTIVTAGTDGFSIWTNDIKCWRDIIAVAAGENHIVGLNADGTVIVTKQEYRATRECDYTGNWCDVIAVAAGYSHTVGLKVDGTVVVAEQYDTNTRDWCDIIAVAAGGDGLTVGLKADGTVVAAGSIPDVRRDIGGWRGIIAVAAGNNERTDGLVGLKADGTVVAAGRISDKDRRDIGGWRDIVAVAAGKYIVGLKADSTVVAIGGGTGIIPGIGTLCGIGPADKELIRKRAEAEEQEMRREEQQRRSEHWKQQGLCYYCGGELGGLFTKKCKSCGKPQ